jgi:hypothetical protein
MRDKEKGPPIMAGPSCFWKCYSARVAKTLPAFPVKLTAAR